MTSSSERREEGRRSPADAVVDVAAVQLGYRYEPRLMRSAFVLSLVAALPDALLALWFKVMADGVAAHDGSRVLFAAIALGVSAAGTWFLARRRARACSDAFATR